MCTAGMPLPFLASRELLSPLAVSSKGEAGISVGCVAAMLRTVLCHRHLPRRPCCPRVQQIRATILRGTAVTPEHGASSALGLTSSCSHQTYYFCSMAAKPAGGSPQAGA